MNIDPEITAILCVTLSAYAATFTYLMCWSARQNEEHKKLLKKNSELYDALQCVEDYGVEEGVIDEEERVTERNPDSPYGIPEY